MVGVFLSLMIPDHALVRINLWRPDLKNKRTHHTSIKSSSQTLDKSMVAATRISLAGTMCPRKKSLVWEALNDRKIDTGRLTNLQSKNL